MKIGASSVVRRRIVLAIVALAFCGIGTLWLFDLIPDPPEIRDRLDGSGAAGPVVFLLAFIAIQPWGLPGALFIVPAALVWPPLVAFGLSWLGANLAALLGFLFARWAGRDWARSRLGSFVATYDERLARHGFATVLALRLAFVCAPPTSWLLGVSRISSRTYVLASALGFIPGIALMTLLGNRGQAAIEDRSGGSLLLLLGALAIFIVYQIRIRSVAARSIVPAPKPEMRQPEMREDV